MDDTLEFQFQIKISDELFWKAKLNRHVDLSGRQSLVLFYITAEYLD